MHAKSNSRLLARPILWFGCASVVVLAVIAGCHRPEPKAVVTKPPDVLVSYPTEETITEYEEFTGRTMAISTVEIRARVSGYLDRNFFVDGADVKAGEPLFQIDPRPFQAEVDRAAAAVAQAESRLVRLERQEERARKLRGTGAVTEEGYDLARFDRDEAHAALLAAQAMAETANLNLGFTHINSPITGRISRRLVDPGNLIQADMTPLANIVTQDPIYGYFDFDERTALRLRRMIIDEKLPDMKHAHLDVKFSLADQEKFTIPGTIDFLDNQVDSATGTLRVRAVIKNQDNLLSPGLFVRVQVPVSQPHAAILVREEALGTDQGQRYVYVVDDKDEISYRRVKAGFLNEGRRVIESGLKTTDRVVVRGLQRVRPGVKVVPKPADSSSDLAATPAARG
jgi:RND family efflux transporter MFP subunit